jgi:ABC-type multidrug transport system ATPase subunit
VLQVTGLRFPDLACGLFHGGSVAIPPGVSLVRGGEGRGKTTLLRLLAGALAAPGGQFQLRGVDLNAQPQVYRQQVFWADPSSQVHDQHSTMTYFGTLPGRYPAFDLQAAGELAEDLGLSPHLDKPLYMLSTGSRRKVWLTAALASGAAVTLLDEPFAALDRRSVNEVLDLLASAAGHGTRAWVVADYVAPAEVPLASVIDLGD